MSDKKILTFDDIVFDRDITRRPKRPGEPEVLSARIGFNNREWMKVWTRLDLTPGMDWTKWKHLSSQNRIFRVITSREDLLTGLFSPESITEVMVKLQMRVL
jgi:hypothetical protein